MSVDSFLEVGGVAPPHAGVLVEEVNVPANEPEVLPAIQAYKHSSSIVIIHERPC